MPSKHSASDKQPSKPWISPSHFMHCHGATLLASSGGFSSANFASFFVGAGVSSGVSSIKSMGAVAPEENAALTDWRAGR